jgi:uracil-DNA glycosylase family 4
VADEASARGLLACRSCPRLAAYLDDIRVRWPDYHARPVPAFGAAAPRLLIVGLAPGLHGANRSGRPFTGDHAGILLYATLHRFGFASAPVSRSADDALELLDCRITNAVKCVPPQNAPTPAEIRDCNRHLAAELQALTSVRVILALGAVAHRATLAALGERAAAHAFAHGARHALRDGRTLHDSYHCSRYNTQTRRLTADGFAEVFARIRGELDGASSHVR